MASDKTQGSLGLASPAPIHLVADKLTDVVIYTLDPNGNVATWNKGAQRLQQYTAEEIIGKHFSCFYLPEDIAAGKPEAELALALSAGQAQDEGRRKRKDGSLFRANVVITPVYDSKGQHLGFGKVTRDISGDLSQEHMRSVLDHVLDGIISTDESGTIQSFNLAAEDIFGYRQAEVIGQDVKMLMPESQHGAHDSYPGGYLRRGAAKVVGTNRLVTGRRRDASTFPMELAISSFERDGQLFFTGIMRDVSERVNEAARMRAILENVPDSIIMVGNNGLVKSANHAAEEMTGYSAAEIIGQPIYLLMPEEEQPRMAKLLERMFRGEQSRAAGLEMLCRRKDGTIIPTDLSLNEFAFGEEHYIISVARDSTTRRDREARLRSILDNASDAIITVDENGMVQSFNRAAEGLYGYTEAEMIGQEVFVLAHEAERATFADLMQRLCRGEQAKMHGIEGKGQRKDGTTFPLELSLNVFAFGEQHYVIGLYRDTTERRDKEARLRAILDNASDAIITFDEDGLILSFNQTAEKTFGYREAEAIGQSVYDLGTTDRRTYFRELVGGMFRGEQSQALGIESTGLRKDGSTFPLDISLSEFSLEDQRYVIAISHDATQRKKLEDQLRQSQKMEAIGRLAGGVAHDFNNVLTVIIAYSQMTLKRLPEDGKLRDYTTQILQAGERAALITQQLLAFSRQQVLAPRVLDLNTVVEETEKMLQRLIGEDISMTTSLAPLLSPILVDQGQLVQVIMNLVVNARDAMPRGGKLAIQTSSFYIDAEAAKELLEYRPGAHVMLSVSDSGIGMTPDIRQRIFEPFFTTKGPGEGTGLGLATVYGIIKQSGGHIEVYSEPNVGTTFKLFFPAVEEASVPLHSAEAMLADGGTETILIVEDDVAVRQVAVDVMEEEGYKLLVAGGGREALELVRTHKGRIDLLLTDLIMPEMSGRQVAEAVVQLLPGIKVLYMSGYTDDDVVRHGLVSDTVAFLQKPFTSIGLGSKVRAVLDS